MLVTDEVAKVEEEWERRTGVPVLLPTVVSLWLSRLGVKNEAIDLIDPERFREAFSFLFLFPSP